MSKKKTGTKKGYTFLELLKEMPEDEQFMMLKCRLFLQMVEKDSQCALSTLKKNPSAWAQELYQRGLELSVDQPE